MDAPARTMAIAATRAGPVDADTSFVEVEVDLEATGPHDLLVEVHAVSVNPVDVWVRASFGADQEPKVLGFDAAGVVVAVGSAVTAYSVGAEVYYAGSIARRGSNAAYQLVDERIVGPKPTTLDFAAAAALPLTTITAWESLFERFRLTETSAGVLLVMAGAGGVGSIAIQLARQLTNVTVIATASRTESVEWAYSMGAHHVVDHHHLAAAVKAVAPQGVNWVLSPFSAGNVEAFADLMAFRGEVVGIDEPDGLDILPLKSKSQTWHWELMFSRPLHDPESTGQRDLLTEVARLVDAGLLRTTMTQRLAPIGVESLREAHRLVESSAMIGKVVIARG
jgi:NADPH:quinone reductase